MRPLTNLQPARDPRSDEVALVASQYCSLIDASGPDTPHWLREITPLLPRLHAAMASVHIDCSQAAYDVPVDLDRRFELFSHLRALLGDRDGYFLEFDRAHEGADAMTGSLADDLTDIYCELKHGLLAAETDPARALGIWCFGYEAHWGQHLMDAERQLANLAATNRLG
jgi:hypothetical protein